MPDTDEITNSTIHILIVEDEEQLLQSMQYSLQRNRFKTTCVQNGLDALSIINQLRVNKTPISLIVTDIQMPGMNGEELIKEIRSSDSKIPILAITGFGDKEMVVRLMRIGCNDYIDKPFSNEEFLSSIQKLIKIIINEREATTKNDAERERDTFIIDRELSLLRSKYHDLHEQVTVVAAEYHSQISIHPELIHTPIFFKNHPLTALGGDFAAVKNTDNGIIALVADVAGHDMAASYYTMILKTFFNEHCNDDLKGSILFELVNRALLESTNHERAITACMLRINLVEMWAELTSAAHPEVIMIEANDCLPKPLYTSGNVLGMYDNITFETRRISIKSGDRFFLYTDGLASASSFDLTTCKKHRITQAGIDKILIDSAQKSLVGISEHLWSEIASFCRNKFNDDALLLSIEIPECGSCFQ